MMTSQQAQKLLNTNQPVVPALVEKHLQLAQRVDNLEKIEENQLEVLTLMTEKIEDLYKRMDTLRTDLIAVRERLSRMDDRFNQLYLETLIKEPWKLRS